MSLMLIWTDIIDEYECLKVHKKCVHKHFPRERRWEVSTGWESGSHTAEHTVNTTRGSSDTLQPTHTPKHTHTHPHAHAVCTHKNHVYVCFYCSLTHASQMVTNWAYFLHIVLAGCRGHICSAALPWEKLRLELCQCLYPTHLHTKINFYS